MASEEAEIDWKHWEEIIKRNMIVIDRPKNTPHPRYPDRIYPLDYGYVKNTKGEDNEEVDVFVGSTKDGLVGAILTVDTIKKDKEIKLLWNMNRAEAETAAKFVNYGGMTGRLIWRDKTNA